MRFASQTLRSYNGDALALPAFLNSITMLKTMSDGTFDVALKQVILTKIEGKAYQYIKPDSSIDEMVQSLKTNITFDMSKVVLSSMKNLRWNKLSPQEYSRQAEELAESLQRSLVMEGVGHEKATEMTIEHTVEMCRKNAKAAESRTVIASSSYKNPKEVIAKLVTEQSKGDESTQISAYGQAKNFNRNRQFQNRGGGRWKNQNYNQNWRNNNHGYNNGSGNGNWRNKNQRGRGKRNFNVRVAENSGAPSDERRGTENSPTTFTLERVSMGQ